MRRSLLPAYSLMMMNRGGAPAVNPLSPPVTANLQLFLSASSLTAADGDPIETWPDLSGNNRNATQGVLANRPLYKTNVINGRPVLRFDGAGDGITVTSAITSNPVTIYVVQRTTDTSYIWFIGDATINSGKPFLIAGIQGSSSTELVFDSGSPSYYVNGTLQSWTTLNNIYTTLNNLKSVTTILSANLSAWAAFRIGNYLSFEYAGDIAAILIYSGAHSTADRTAVENWLKEVYGLS